MYRDWFQKLRDSWSLGHHDEKAEGAVMEVLRELKKRYPQFSEPDKEDKPIWATKIDIGVEAGAKIGHEELPLEAKAGVNVKAKDIEIGVPNKIRNWIVERVLFRRHKKFLLRISIANTSYDNFTMGLHKIWRRGS
jgi:hypothetical protein